uniref:50S ribosomal protein L35 n=1 Tax=Cyanoptyche gloeocystis TaxID=77922 RepID=A0A3G1IWC1_9EUKA|nr:ribosomal protein L35 [Cyanoptyche gloeocystis]
MYKLKTRRSAAKRFKITGKNKILRRKAFKNHLLQKKNSSRKLRLSKMVSITLKGCKRICLMLPNL